MFLRQKQQMATRGVFGRIAGGLVICIMILLFTGTHAKSIAGPHINVLNLLLPPRALNPVSYGLQGSDGCFIWTWDQHDMLSVVPEYNETDQCSASAQLISIAPYSGRRVTAVYASDINSGQAIRCEVFVDKISRIQIFHHSVRLDLDGVATLRVHAFDDEDNVFSSLVGLRFIWNLSPVKVGSNPLPHRLSRVPLRNAHLSDPSGFSGDIAKRVSLEESGYGSDWYVVRGIEVGQETVSVRLAEPELEHLSHTITLTVTEAISLEPSSPVFVIIGTKLQYGLRVFRRNKLEAVDLPSMTHHWFVTNSSVASIDPSRAIIIADNIGITSVVVEDLRVAGHQQISTLHVVIPSELRLYLSSWTGSEAVAPVDEIVSSMAPWYLIVGQEYVVHVKAFSWQSGGRPLSLTESNMLELQFDKLRYWSAFPVPQLIAAEHGWQNCSYLLAKAEGEGELVASLTYFVGHHHKDQTKRSVVPDKAITVKQEVKVCTPVKIYFSDTVGIFDTLTLPWLPGIHQKLELSVQGGCGESHEDYHWYSSDTATLSLTAPGVFHARRPGRIVIKAVAVVDKSNYDQVMVDVSVPSSLALLKGLPVETVVGSHLPAAVTLRDKSGHHYSRCDAFNSVVEWEVSGAAHTFDVANGTSWNSWLSLIDSHYVDNVSNGFGTPVCAWTSLYASQTGRASLSASMSGISQDIYTELGSSNALKVSWTVAAYAPLAIHQAGDGNGFGGYKCHLDATEWQSVGLKSKHCFSLNELLLAPGSGMKILLLGGPEPWRQGVEFVQSYNTFSANLTSLHKESFLIKQLADSEGKLYWISCLSLGTFIIRFRRGNLIGEDHPSPAISETDLSVRCSLPSSITLIADEPENTLPIIRAASQAEYSDDHVRVIPVIVTNGRTIRIAAVSLHLSGKPFANSSSLLLKWSLTECGGKAFWASSQKALEKNVDDSWEKFLVLQNASGQCIVRARVSGLTSSRTGGLGESSHGSIDHVLTDAILLQLVSFIHIEPKSVMLFYHPDAEVALSVFGGTSAVKASVNDTKIAKLMQETSRSQPLQLVVAPMGLGVALLTVQDIGLASPSSASALISIADVDWIKILLPEEISILLGSVRCVEIVAGSHDGQIFDGSQVAFMSVHVHAEDDILEHVDEDGFPKPSDSRVMGSTFSIRGSSIGFTTTLHVSARQSSGRQIFSEFTKVEVYGPLLMHPPSIFLAPGAKYTLSVQGGPQAGVMIEYFSVESSVATVDKISGEIVAVSSGKTSIKAHAYNSAGDLVCEATGSIHVGIPTSMSLNLGNVQLGVGRTLSVFPTCTEGDLFSFYEMCRDYEWKIENDQILSFQSMEGSSALKREDVSSMHNKGYDYDFIDLRDVTFGTRVTGRSAGRTTLSVSFVCDFREGNEIKSLSYSTHDTIRVISDLPLALGMPFTLVLPPFYVTSDVLPEWIEPSHRWEARKLKGHVIYTPLMCNVSDGTSISIRDGCIETSDRNNIGCIEARDRATGRREIAACVRVAEVCRLALKTENFPYHVLELSVGSHQNLLIDYHDDLGNSFFEAHGAIPLSVDTNYPEVVLPKVTNVRKSSSLHLEALHQGKALIRLTLHSNPPATTFILIHVGAYISPRNPVFHVGGRVNFSITGKGFRGNEQGQWSSTNENVLVIEGFSGEARAVAEGTAQVLFKSQRLSARTSVTVVKVASIIVSSPHEFVTNVPFPEKGYNFTVSLSDLQGHNYKVLGEDMGNSYSCDVYPASIGHCWPWRDVQTGSLYCIFLPHSPERLAHMGLSMEDADPSLFGDQNGVLQASVVAVLKGANNVRGSTEVTFKGGFSVLGADQVHLTSISNKSQLTIVGSAGAVKFHWQAKDYMVVPRVTYKSMGAGSFAQYEIRAIKQEAFRDTLEISLPTTGQKIKIPVQYVSGMFDVSSLTIHNTAIAVAVSVALIVLSIFIYLRLLDQPELASQTRRGFERARTPDAFIPEETPSRSPRTPPSASNLRTPHASFPRPNLPPHPYTDYVRRTIDETPLFKGNGHRRIDPSYTY